MGVLNVTPDSFFDGGRYTAEESARRRIDALLDEGAEIVDIGGESSRPGAKSVGTAEQIERIDAAVRYALQRGAVVSIDTTDPKVADCMLQLGAHLVNDVSCLADPELARVCARHDAVLLLMHSRGPMSRMPGFSVYPNGAYGDVVADVLSEWRSRRDEAMRQGLSGASIWLDPGLGFGKNARHSLALLRGLGRLCEEGVPVAVGPSRKSFISAVDDSPPEQRLGGSIAACMLAVEAGARLLRVHDVHDVHQALRMQHEVRLGASEVARA